MIEDFPALSFVLTTRRRPSSRRRARIRGPPRAGTRAAISRWADSGLSLPWIRLFCLLIEKSPRIVPGCGGGAVGRAQHRPDHRDRLVPLEHAHDHRRAGDELDQPLEERLALVLGIMLLGERAIDAGSA